MAKKDPVREFLRQRGSPSPVVDGGLPGLIASWEKAVDEVVHGYGLGLDDYLNDMDGRELLRAALALAPAAERKRLRPRIQAADHRIKPRLGPAGPCLWGKQEAHERGWTPLVNWWYFRRPKRAGEEFEKDWKGRFSP